MDEYLAKFENKKLADARDHVNLVSQWPIFDDLAADLYHPEVLLAMERAHTTLNMFSQGVMTQTKTSKKDLLHCVVSGLGEKVSLASPFQRVAMAPGEPIQIENQETEQMEDVNIPTTYSFVDLALRKNKDDEIHYLKAMHNVLKPGDCIHIPAYWWYQIQTRTPKKPASTHASTQQKFKEQSKPLSLSVDFWYHVPSYQLENFFDGIEKGLLK